jgi:methanogenic corrinoid protein MtbC1
VRQKGGLSFITNYAMPFLARIGSDWEESNLKISKEKGIKVLVTTLPGEPYNLGALMCAIVTSITDSKVIYLCIDTPTKEIVSISKTYKPKIISLSISHAMKTSFLKIAFLN